MQRRRTGKCVVSDLMFWPWLYSHARTSGSTAKCSSPIFLANLQIRVGIRLIFYAYILPTACLHIQTGMSSSIELTSTAARMHTNTLTVVTVKTKISRRTLCSTIGSR
jgi:hypothetical protein